MDTLDGLMEVTVLNINEYKNGFSIWLMYKDNAYDKHYKILQRKGVTRIFEISHPYNVFKNCSKLISKVEMNKEFDISKVFLGEMYHLSDIINI